MRRARTNALDRQSRPWKPQALSKLSKTKLSVDKQQVPSVQVRKSRTCVC